MAAVIEQENNAHKKPSTEVIPNITKKSAVEIYGLWLLATGSFIFTLLAASPPIFRVEGIPIYSMLGIVVCSISLVFLRGPSLAWVYFYIFKIDRGKINAKEKNIQKRADKLNEYCKVTTKSLHIIAGDFDNPFFEREEVLDGFAQALANGAQINVIMGDKGIIDRESFTDSFVANHPEFVKRFKDLLLKRKAIQLWFGKRQVRHGYVSDQLRTILEFHLNEKQLSTWTHRNYSVGQGVDFVREFNKLTKSMTQINVTELPQRLLNSNPKPQV